MVPNEEGLNYLSLEKVSALLRGIRYKHHSDLYFLNQLLSFATKNKRQSHRTVFEKKICNVLMTSEYTMILEFNQYQKPYKELFVAFVDLECLIEKINGCKNNSETSFTTIIGKHIPSDFSMSTVLSFQNMENAHDVYRGKDCRKKLFESLRKHVVKIINF